MCDCVIVLKTADQQTQAILPDRKWQKGSYLATTKTIMFSQRAHELPKQTHGLLFLSALSNVRRPEVHPWTTPLCWELFSYSWLWRGLLLVFSPVVFAVKPAFLSLPGCSLTPSELTGVIFNPQTPSVADRTLVHPVMTYLIIWNCATRTWGKKHSVLLINVVM